MKIIKIGAIWCPGCLVMKKVWKNIENDYNDIEIIDLDYDIDTDRIKEYNIGNILPVVIFLDKDSQEIARLIGEQKENKLRETIDKYKVM